MMLKDRTISLPYYYVQGKGNIVSDMDGEKVMLSIHNGKYYNLGEIGGRIWELIARPVEISQIVAALMSEYEVDQSECELEVISFIGMLSKEGLIESGEDYGLL
ncbi:lasso peptide biosynthesis PqqD family chaperone [Paenibacillus sp. N3.4]|uniref:lasso peptide biosynthesis PqqD family chaperone n=1 Tax=Paenibacillus sp. N3.4 TaxID=2603222 RepID=UPI0011CA22AA|nr:lasso peptide biosynthesis PqqD family chaperone [Paenibacillus sp. N3.4]TXK82499.1 lasso peptide biosynthesis PqqD family chaperone [Paenibacillus sp. N3.4]